MIEDGKSEAFIIRFPKMNLGGTRIHSYISNFETIKTVGLPTLKTVEQFEIGNKTGIRTEDINYQKEDVYVTHNSLYGDSKRMVDMLSQNFIEIDKNKKSPEYEEFRYRNKLKEITNFEEFINVVTK